jgi:16S rRNA (uracil1498-N3)-methyltransferase
LTLRLYVDAPLQAGAEIDLPPGPARHAQVRRAQPGDALVLFNGRGGEWQAQVLQMGRQRVAVRVDAHQPVEREASLAITIALGVPANERMDALVEKSTELGVASIQPLLTERSVLRLSGERAGRKREHWQAVAVAAAEQCGRTRVPAVSPVRSFGDWLADPPAGERWLLSPGDAAPRRRPAGALTVLSGPEGGFSADEVGAAQAAGFLPTGLGSRVLRADTAPLVVLAWAMLAV